MTLQVDIQKKYPDFTLDIHFQTDSRRIGILGPSGCGKSMTLRTIAGIHHPDAGRIVKSKSEIVRDNQSTQKKEGRSTAEAEKNKKALSEEILYDSQKKINIKTQKRRIGYMFQNYALFPAMTVKENIKAGLRMPKAEAEKEAMEMMKRFHLQGLENQRPSQLSGGQKQRVALARMMATRPDMILLDEPFSALDWFLKDQMQREMEDFLRSYEGIVILVSHDRDEIYRFSDELIVMEKGRVIRQGETREVFRNPGSAAVARLTGCKNISRAERIDDHHLKALDWGVKFELQQTLPEKVENIGFRAHQFRPLYISDEEASNEERRGKDSVCKAQEADERKDRQLCGNNDRKGSGIYNCIPCKPDSMVQMQFERNYYIRPQTEGEGSMLTWYAQRQQWTMLDEKGLPDYLYFPEEDILIL